MPHLMCKSEYLIQIVMIVHQHIGMRSIGTPGIGSALLPLILIYIDPAAVKAFLQNCKIFLA